VDKTSTTNVYHPVSIAKTTTQTLTPKLIEGCTGRNVAKTPVYIMRAFGLLNCVLKLIRKEFKGDEHPTESTKLDSIIGLLEYIHAETPRYIR